MDFMNLIGMFPGLMGGAGGQMGTFSGAPTGGGFGESVGNPIAGAFGGGPGAGLNISNGMMPQSTMPQAGAYGMYQPAEPTASSDVDFGAAKALMSMSGGMGGQNQPQMGGMGAAMAGGGGGGNTKGLFSALMRGPSVQRVNPTAGLLNILG
ncbi:hypothetical protein K6V92_10235 [Cupriavidus respiraculi]|uniref:hypothetical protein n=1 Tax=Cupriavidus respiraculi TaxID=195930 RepID=UPI001C94C4E0|nr:hypothetical protein [Cupriavidus respiraculi]MBY4946996.1 hypothetical protein [Cupriavidus respiraculi]